jgi:pimeloyl-ACP methyl ester carboxylesterase
LTAAATIVRRPFYDRNGERSIFAVEHGVCTSGGATAGVLFCQSVGAEYFSYHKAVIQLADALGRLGTPSMRFDYSGCGDSEGGIESMSIANWLDDTARMAEVLRAETKVRSICVVGIGLGSALAAMYASKVGRVDRLVLWHPVVNGRRYAASLVKAHKNWLRGSFAREDANDCQLQCMGFLCPGQLHADIEAIDLMAFQAAPAREALILHDAREDGKRLGRRWRSLSCEVETGVMGRDGLALATVRTIFNWVRR